MQGNSRSIGSRALMTTQYTDVQCRSSHNQESPDRGKLIVMTSVIPPPVVQQGRCPRCGYNLQGLIDSWKDQCPLDGLCSECGLAFEFVNICRPGRLTPPWCLEYFGGPRALFGTTWRLCAPWVFWRSLQMWHPPHLARIAMFAVVVSALMALLTYGGVQTSAAAVVYWRVDAALTASNQRARLGQPALAQYWRNLVSTHDAIERGEEVTPLERDYLQQVIDNLHAHQLAPIVDQYQRGEIDEDALRRNERETLGHILSAFEKFTPSTLDMTMFAAVMEAIQRPLSVESSGRINPGGRQYIAPKDLHDALTVADPLNPGIVPFRSSSLRQTMLEAGVVPFLGTFLVNAIMPLTLLLLVQTRRTKRLHWKHLLRATPYASAAILLLCLLWIIVCHAVALVMNGVPVRNSVHILLNVGALGLWLFVWWYCVLRNYARMPHSLLVTLVNLGLAVLVVVVVSTLALTYGLRA